MAALADIARPKNFLYIVESLADRWHEAASRTVTDMGQQRRA
jgi:hypothetical protein